MDHTTLLIIILSLSVFAAIVYLVPYLKTVAQGKNINVEDTLNTTEQIVNIINLLLKNTNMVSPEQKVFIEKVATASQLAVRYAEQLYKSGQCEKEQRKAKAIEFVKQILQESGIDVTPEKEDIINKTIEAAVFLLPNTKV